MGDIAPAGASQHAHGLHVWVSDPIEAPLVDKIPFRYRVVGERWPEQSEQATVDLGRA